ncbi:MAG TPA: MlaD family protein [Streptosporangiaceae bacterium]|nr:MlaD family protein [Streptosporangiaceae bacterium]
MTSRLVRYQLVAFVVVTVLGVTYAMLQYVGLPRILGFGQYHVSVALPASGGLYTDAIVTERGVPVGKVAGIRLGGRGAVADISLNDGARIPADLRAAVRNTSAIGEQYLELTPQRAGPPYLRPGAMVPERDVSLPTPPGTLLTDVNSLLNSVPRAQLSTTINELYNAFNGSGPDLQRLLDSSRLLLAAAHAHLPPTSKLITQLQPVLRTQQARSADIASFSRHLASFTRQLRASNATLRGSLQQLPGFTTELNALVTQVQPTVPLLLANLTAVGQVLEVYLPNLRQILVVLPADINDVTAAILTSPVPGSANMDFKSTVNNPPPCQQGYPATMRPPSDTSPASPPTPAPRCRAPGNSSLEVRGARNNPCPNNPAIRSATAAGCGLIFQAADSGAGTRQHHGTRHGGGRAVAGAATYDPVTGLFFGPDGILYSVGAGSVSGRGPATLGQLLRQTLGG